MKGVNIPMPTAPQPWGQPWQELCWLLRPALAHTPSHGAAKMLQCRANVPGRRQGCISVISLRKYPRCLTAANQFWLPPGGCQMEICSAFCQPIHPRQPCQKLPSSGKPSRHTAKVPLTLASRFSCSPIPQTLRLLHRPPGKLLSGTRDSQPCWWPAREMKLLNMVGIGNLRGLFQP